jgi:hypothetical protein
MQLGGEVGGLKFCLLISPRRIPSRTPIDSRLKVNFPAMSPSILSEIWTNYEP